MIGNRLKLYTFVDNHDVERIYTKLKNKKHFTPVHVMLYTLPGIPSLYYGSEFGIEGKKERFSDDSLRPALTLEAYKDAVEKNSCTKLIAALGKIRQNTPVLCYGEYKELLLQTTHFAYARILDGKSVITTLNNGGNEVTMNLQAGNSEEYIGALTGTRVKVNGGEIQVQIPADFGEIWIPAELYDASIAPVQSMEIMKMPETVKAEETKKEEGKVTVDWSKSYDEMTVEELQEAILEKMRKNGPVTEYMLGTVRDNTHKVSLVNWVKSFR